MPLIMYLCICGESVKKFLRSAKDAPPTVVCLKCGLDAKKVFGSTSSSYKIRIDNGLMTKAIEVDPNINEINDERSARNYSEED